MVQNGTARRLSLHKVTQRFKDRGRINPHNIWEDTSWTWQSPKIPWREERNYLLPHNLFFWKQVWDQAPLSIHHWSFFLCRGGWGEGLESKLHTLKCISTTAITYSSLRPCHCQGSKSPLPSPTSQQAGRSENWLQLTHMQTARAWNVSFVIHHDVLLERGIKMVPDGTDGLCSPELWPGSNQLQREHMRPLHFFLRDLWTQIDIRWLTELTTHVKLV